MDTSEGLTGSETHIASASTQLREVLAIRDVRLLLLSRLVSNVGNGMSPVALSFAVLELKGASASSLSIVNGAHLVSLAGFMLAGGVVADRWGRCRTVGLTDILGSMVVGVMAALLVGGAATVPLLAVCAFVMGALHALWQPAFRGIMPQIVPRHLLQAANASNGVTANFAYIIGAATAGAVVAFAGAGWAIALDGATFLVAGVIVWRLRHLDTATGSGESTMLQELREGWREFVARRWMVTTVVCLALFFMVFEAFLGVIGPVQMKESGGARDMGIMMSGWGVGGLAGMLAAVRLRPRRPMLAAWAVMPLHSLWIASVAGPLPLPLVFLAAVLSGIAIDLTFTWWGTVLQTHVPPEAISRVGSWDALGVVALGPVGLVIAGPLVDAWGGSRVALGAGALALVVGVAPLLSRSVRMVERLDL